MKITRRPPKKLGRLFAEPLVVPGFTRRSLRIYLPSDHREDEARPLLFLFDGQNVFDHQPSFSGGWMTHEAIERLSKKRPHPIVVGLDHGGEGRLSELSPWTVKGQPGRADEFLTFVARDLLPGLRARFRVVEGPVGVLLGGSSMGGLAATYGHLKYPQAFGGALAMSPSFWVGGAKLLALVHRHAKPWVSQIYLDCGRDEGGGKMAPLVERVAAELRARHYDDDHLKLRIDARGTHSEAAWRRRLLPALRWFYRPR